MYFVEAAPSRVGMRVLSPAVREGMKQLEVRRLCLADGTLSMEIDAETTAQLAQAVELLMAVADGVRDAFRETERAEHSSTRSGHPFRPEADADEVRRAAARRRAEVKVLEIARARRQKRRELRMLGATALVLAFVVVAILLG